MPITDAKDRARIFMILGVPDRDSVAVTFGQFTFEGFRTESFDNTAQRATIVAALAATNTDEDALIQLILTEFDTFWLKETEVIEDNGTRGVLLDIEAKFDVWRKRLSKVLGFINVLGDSDDEIRNRVLGSGGGRIFV